MKFKLALAVLAVAGYVLPAAAQTTYYIVQDTKTHHCRIVDQRPTTRDITVVGMDGYPTEVAAQSAMKTVKVCESD